MVVHGSDPTTAASRLGAVAGVRGAVALRGAAWRQGNTAIVAVVPAANGNTTAGRRTLERVRAIAHALPGRSHVGGDVTQNADFISAVSGNFPLMLALIALVTFVFLVRAFRSLVLPLKAIALNVVSVAAAYGVMVVVWQDGHSSHLIWGADPADSITTWVPLLTFAILFALSMDYEVFVFARMREEHDAGCATDAAVNGAPRQTRGALPSVARPVPWLPRRQRQAVPDRGLVLMARALPACPRRCIPPHLWGMPQALGGSRIPAAAIPGEESG